MIRQLLVSAILGFATTFAAQAQDAGLVTLQTRQDSQGWEAVGRLDIAGKGFCTAALIRDRLILTAAHCLYDNDGTLVAPERFSFQAGLRDGRAQATRAVTRAVAHPEYSHNGDAADTSGVAIDIAVLELDRPIRNTRIRPYRSPNARSRAIRSVLYPMGAGAKTQPACNRSAMCLGGRPV